MSLITIGVAFLWLLLWFFVLPRHLTKHGILAGILGRIVSLVVVVGTILSLSAEIPSRNITYAIYGGIVVLVMVGIS